MYYLYSIRKKVAIKSSSSSIVLSILLAEFEKLKIIEIQSTERKIILKGCIEFSGKSNFKEFNRGKISIEQRGDDIVLLSEIILIEHVIMFVFASVISLYGLIYFQESRILLSIGALCFAIGFVWFYINPMISHCAFWNKIFKEIENLKKKEVK